MNALEIGFLTSGSCVIAELVVVYFLINLIFAKRENKRWGPVRKMVAEQLIETNSSALHTANQIAKLVFCPIDYPSFDVCKIYLQKYRNHLNRLRYLVDLNAMALGSELMPSAVLFVEGAESLIKKLIFFSEIHNPNRKKMDIVGVSPFEEIEGLEDAVDQFKNKCPGILRTQKENPVKDPSRADIWATWEMATNNCRRLFLDPTAYEFKAQVVPYVYDLPSLRLLNMPPSADGARVEVCHHI